MPTIKLQQVKNFDKLLKYLETELGWPVEGREIDDIAFPFDLESDLGLDKNEVAKVRHVYRLKKMHKKQPFGIFFVDFEGKKMPVSVLKRILRNLALKRKANAKAADQLAWDVEDLIFISAVGEEKDSTREISFAHFRKEPDNRHVLKVMAWDGGDTPLKMDHLDDVLHEFLRFPDDTNDVDAWRKSWTAAFRTGIRQNIRRSEELAQALAALAMRINKEALSLIKKESANGPLKTLHAGFKDALIHDLTEEAFTDCYAQTITYGLLTAAITKVNQAGVKDLTSTSVLEMVPSTNPFLKDILSSFLEAGGRGEKGIDFDDLGVQDVIDLLRAESTDLPNILRDFGNLTQDEDPVIHFYETFLKIYNKDERVKRGAFYTPRPVVSYIVRSVDELLRKDFGLEDGLADTTTWGEMIKRNPAIKLPPLTDNPGEKKTIKETEPFVQILDPATGTATFLVEAINIIEKTVKAKAWAKLKNGPYDQDQHSKRDEVLKAWNEYVPEHLLKRLHAYELMMAPYVIAHMKVGLKLAETGYRFATEERARIYLTNALEPAKDFKDRLNFDIPALAIEAKQVNEIKKTKRFTVVIGNPPYSGLSSNMLGAMQEIVDGYKIVDGESLNERKLWLQDDYVKFFRISQMLIDISGSGVLGFITNHGYLENPTFRGMRQSLMGSFSKLYLIDLHGNANKKELSPDGSDDKNVFDIKQGVGICLATRGSGRKFVGHADLWGTRSKKYDWLSNNNLSPEAFTSIAPISQLYLFKPFDESKTAEYSVWMPINEVMPYNVTGLVTARDDFVIDFEKSPLEERISDLRSTELSDQQIRDKYFVGKGSKKYPPGDSRGWKLPEARKKLKKDAEWKKRYSPLLYRPFDVRIMYYVPWMVDWPRSEAMEHLFAGDNISLTFHKREELTGGYAHFFCSRIPTEHGLTSSKTTNYQAPLYLYHAEGTSGADLFSRSKEGDTKRSVNLSGDFIEKLKLSIGLEYIEDGCGNLRSNFGPEDTFYYIYGLFYSPSYREKYVENLKLDFPRVPSGPNIELFKRVISLGRKLAGLHLMEAGQLKIDSLEYIGRPGCEMCKPYWANETVWVDDAKTCGFKGVTEDVWNFRIGGYQVCDKWLNDRRKAGRRLSRLDIESYVRVLAALRATLMLMAEVDQAIDEHGGWPKAFH